MIDYGKGHCISTIMENSQLGIRGKLERAPKTVAQTAGYDVCYKQDIRIGTAYIISAVSGEYETYEIQIESLDYSGKEENKGILFRVTDPKAFGTDGRDRAGNQRKCNANPGRKNDRCSHACICIGCIAGLWYFH